MAVKKLNSKIQSEIQRISSKYAVESAILENFAAFVISSSRPVKKLSIHQLKAAVLHHFEVEDTTQLRRSGAFKMATDGMDNLNLRLKEDWEKLYREFVGILPGEDNDAGYGCINGLNIFNYFRPWTIFGLDAETAKDSDIKEAYRKLSKTYHPDVPKTGDAKIFDRINTMYQSISAEA